MLFVENNFILPLVKQERHNSWGRAGDLEHGGSQHLTNFSLAKETEHLHFDRDDQRLERHSVSTTLCTNR